MYLREFHFRHLLFQALECPRTRKNQDFDSEIRTRIRKVGKPIHNFGSPVSPGRRLWPKSRLGVPDAGSADVPVRIEREARIWFYHFP